MFGFYSIGKSFVDGIADSLSEKMSMIAEGFSFEESAAIIGDQLGRGSIHFLKKLDFPKLFEVLSEVFNSSAERLNLEAGAKNIGKQFKLSIEKTSEPMNEAIGKAVGDFFRNITLNSVPYLAAGSALMVGVPLAVHYGYKKAIHSMGKPKLISEVRYVGLLNRIEQKVSNLFKNTLDLTAPALKWTSALGFTALALYLPVLIGCVATRCETDQQVFNDKYIETAAAISLSAGGIAGLSSLYGKIKEWFKRRPQIELKPVFDQSLIEQINDITNSTYNLKKNGGFFQNVLLYGPGGTGKTMVAKMIARNSNMNYIMMSGGDLAQYIKRGEHVTELNNLFSTIKNSSSPTILFIDEIESLCGDRKKMDKSELFELLNAFLSHTGEESDKFMLIGATNMPEMIDEAVLSRMDHKLHIGAPKFEERLSILSQALAYFFSKNEIESSFSDERQKQITSLTDGLTGRAIFKMINALYSKKMATADQQLTEKMIFDTVDHFVRQEEEMKGKDVKAKIVGNTTRKKS